MQISDEKRKSGTTLRDVALRAGVSPQTVSVVLNGSRSGTKVSTATRRRIEEAAVSLHYHPNAVARGLSRRRMDTLCVLSIYPDPGLNIYFMTILAGILRAGMRYQQSVTVFAGDEWSNVKKTIPAVCDGRCDGVLLLGSPQEVVEALLHRHIPFVLINEPHPAPQVTRIDVDNVAASRTMIHYLFAQGHRRVAVFCGDAPMESAQERLEGYLSAHREAGIPCDSALIFEGTYSEYAGGQNARLLMRLPASQRPTAVFCSNDDIALGALNAFRELGVRVPEDISVAGFDDIILAALAHPPLTTVRQPLARIGERATEMLLAQIENRVPPGQKEVIPTEIIVRDSVRALLGAT